MVNANDGRNEKRRNFRADGIKKSIRSSLQFIERLLEPIQTSRQPTAERATTLHGLNLHIQKLISSQKGCLKQSNKAPCLLLV